MRGSEPVVSVLKFLKRGTPPQRPRNLNDLSKKFVNFFEFHLTLLVKKCIMPLEIQRGSLVFPHFKLEIQGEVLFFPHSFV